MKIILTFCWIHVLSSVCAANMASAQTETQPAAPSSADLAAKCAAAATVWPGTTGGPVASDEALESCAKACDVGDAVSCSSLGHTLEQRLECAASEDQGKCIALFKKSCERECLMGCVGYATYLTYGFGDATPDFKLAAKHLKKACDAGNMVGCFKLGQLKLNEDAGEVDAKQGLKLIDGACQKKHGPACADLSYRYSVGDGVEKDAAKAEKYDALAARCGAALDRPGSPEDGQQIPEEE